jgi:hypothetical protein
LSFRYTQPPIASIISTSGSCRPCRNSLRALTCCRCHKIHEGYVPLKLLFELRPRCDASFYGRHLVQAFRSAPPDGRRIAISSMPIAAKNGWRR